MAGTLERSQSSLFGGLLLVEDAAKMPLPSDAPSVEATFKNDLARTYQRDARLFVMTLGLAGTLEEFSLKARKDIFGGEGSDKAAVVDIAERATRRWFAVATSAKARAEFYLRHLDGAEAKAAAGYLADLPEWQAKAKAALERLERQKPSSCPLFLARKPRGGEGER